MEEPQPASQRHPTSLLSLPNELLHQIAIGIPDIQTYSNFTLTNHRIRSITTFRYTHDGFIAQLKSRTPTIFAYVLEAIFYRLYPSIPPYTISSLDPWIRFSNNIQFHRNLRLLHRRSLSGSETGSFFLQASISPYSLHPSARRNARNLSSALLAASDITVDIDWCQKLGQLLPQPHFRPLQPPTAEQTQASHARLIWDLARLWEDEARRGGMPIDQLISCCPRSKGMTLYMSVEVGYEFVPRGDPTNKSMPKYKDPEEPFLPEYQDLPRKDGSEKRVRWIFENEMPISVDLLRGYWPESCRPMV
ncbi:hypothetical protein BJ508DRAFT_330035 [Ascobolus immersus RN42]|uniref:F-box domain-containing protein n=1 Tax=Ascobolus immersus RN42 TaxID=1160509 RepID=A0A3N4I787_ASCIM|nr:hypothetical protein BJ508DRAFT_330035 [Ascobolus immersus RN42]